MTSWEHVHLGTVAVQHREIIEVDDLQTYSRCRVRLRGQGVVLRDEVAGAAIRTKRQQVCRPNQLLVAEIDAKLGGFGMVPLSLDGALVSSHYFLFDLDRERLEPAFLGHYLRTSRFQSQVRAQGSTNYAAIRPTHVLDYTVPLPPLDEQRRTVALLERAETIAAEAASIQDGIGDSLQDAIANLAASLRGTGEHPSSAAEGLNRHTERAH
jgi:type I restriction enzyme, S subunit